MIRVVVAQRDALTGGALAAVLSAEADLRVVATLAHGDEVPMVTARERAHVVVLDATLPVTATVGELCRTIHREQPTCRPLVLLDRGAGTDLGCSLLPLAPRLGVLATDSDPADLVDGVRRLARGERVVDAHLDLAVRNARANPLTPREQDVFRLVRYGTPPKEIAGKLGLSVGTVRNHLSRGVAKTGARTRLEAIRRAGDAGWI